MRPPIRAFSLLFSLVALSAPALHAQDFSSCAEVNEMVRAEEFGEALWLVERCKNALQTAWYDGLVEALRVPLAGLEPSGGEVEGAMGITTVNIAHGPVETTFTSGAGGAESPMAGLGALASLGSALGVRQPGVEEVRLGRRTTGRLEEKSDGTFSLMVTLEDGVLVQEGPDAEQLQEVAMETIRILGAYFGN